MAAPAVSAAATEIRRRHGVIARSYGNMLGLCPPLILTEEQARRATSALVEVVSRLGTDGKIS
jgi:putrescine aminotransferase